MARFVAKVLGIEISLGRVGDAAREPNPFDLMSRRLQLGQCPAKKLGLGA